MAYPAKVPACVILFFTSFIFGLLPSGITKCLKRRKINIRRISKFIGFLNCFAGGVFFGTALLHLLPESMEKVEEYIESDYPITSALIGAGVFLVMMAEHAFGTFHKHGHSHEHEVRFSKQGDKNIPKTDHGKSVDASNGSITTIAFSKKTSEISNGYDNRAAEISDEDKKAPLAENPSAENESVQHIEGEKSGASVFRTIVLVLALSLHMVFEGLALGLQDTNAKVWQLLGVLTVHKCVVSFSTGLQLNESLKTFRKVILSIAGFSIVAPMGVLIGFLVSEYGGEGSAQGMASGILQSLSTGTFFYVTFFEILQNELANGHNLPKVFVTLLGFLVNIGLKFLPEEEE